MAESSLAELTDSVMTGQALTPAPAEAVAPEAPSAAPDPGLAPGSVTPDPGVTPETSRRIIPSETPPSETPPSETPPTQADALLDSVPGQPSAYDFGEPPDVSEGGVDLTPDFRHWAFEAKLTQRQAQALLDRYNVRVDQYVENQNVRSEVDADADIDALKKEYGGEAGFAENIVVPGDLAVQHLGLSVDTLTALESAVGTRAILELGARIGDLIQRPAAAPATSPAAAPSAVSPAAALETLKSDKDFMSEYLGGNKAALRRMTRAIQAASGPQRSPGVS